MTYEKIQELLANHLDMNAEEITRETTFEQLGIDSLDTVEIMMEIEDEFSIELKPSQDVKNVDALVKYVESVLG